jgi:hypothetical protein
VLAYSIKQLEEETVNAARFRFLASREATPDSNF